MARLTTDTYTRAAEDGDMAQHYHWGQNTPGYLPMADEPNLSTDWADARDGLLEDLDRAGDMANADDCAPSWTASWQEAIEEVRTTPEGEDIYVNVASDGAHDLGVSYWIMACSEAECLERYDDDWGDSGHASYTSAAILLAVAATGVAMVAPMIHAAVAMLGGAS